MAHHVSIWDHIEHPFNTVLICGIDKHPHLVFEPTCRVWGSRAEHWNHPPVSISFKEEWVCRHEPVSSLIPSDSGLVRRSSEPTTFALG